MIEGVVGYHETNLLLHGCIYITIGEEETHTTQFALKPSAISNI